MNIVLGIAAGLVWGGAVALLNGYMTKRAVAKEDPKALTGLSMVRIVVDVAGLAVVFLLRKVLPFSYEAAQISTAVAMSLLTVIITYKISKSI